jgi:hypothetical protein
MGHLITVHHNHWYHQQEQVDRIVGVTMTTTAIQARERQQAKV